MMLSGETQSTLRASYTAPLTLFHGEARHLCLAASPETRNPPLSHEDVASDLRHGALLKCHVQPAVHIAVGRDSMAALHLQLLSSRC